jgi:2-polyprenyl-6-methoxyphenol hydroxylase-like FAD-dependent oxidoreductase
MASANKNVGNTGSDGLILIVGAGPTGLTLASELLRRGVACRIIDMLPGPSEHSKALAIHARTLELFEKMGLVDEILADGLKLHAFTVFEEKKQLVKMTFDEIESPYPYMLSLPQYCTEQILIRHLTACGGTVERNTSLSDLKITDSGITATILSEDQTKEEVNCRWLVGCDGAHSLVRKLIGMQFAGKEYREDWVLADVEFDTTLDMSESYLFANKDGVAGFHPFSSTCGRLFADLGTTHEINQRMQPDIEAPSLEKLQQIFDERGPGNFSITKLNWLTIQSIHRRQVASYRKGDVFLAGDAAHVHSPASGQGMNTGIQDAYNLAWKMALVVNGDSPATLLDSYSVERHAVGVDILRMTDFFTWINIVRNPIAQKIRNKIGPVIAEQEIVASQYRNAVSQLSPNYRRSPAVLDENSLRKVGKLISASSGERNLKHWLEFESAPRAGDRAPNGKISDLSGKHEVSFFEISRDLKHHLLVFVGRHSDQQLSPKIAAVIDLVNSRFQALIKVHVIATSADAMKSWKLPFVIENALPFLDLHLDSELTFHRRYGSESPMLYLVRPDGYIGFRTLSIKKESLADYLSTIFSN